MEDREKMKIAVKKLRGDANLPLYATEGAAASDLYASLDGPLTLKSGERKIVPTGIAMAVPDGFVALLCARSGLASKKGIALANGVGVIDSDYRGEIGVSLINLSQEDRTIEPGERIAQMMILPVFAASFEEAGSLPGTARGEGGFGSTGTK